MDLFKALRSKAISAKEAQGILDKRNDITGKMESVLKAVTDTINNPTVSAYYQNKGNGYLFETDGLSKLIHGSKYVMIILGAHTETDSDFNEGDPTVMIIPCEEPKTAGTTSDKRIIVKSSRNASEVGLEHPPASVVGKVEGNELNFEFV